MWKKSWRIVGVIGAQTPVKLNLHKQIRCLLRQFRPLRLRRVRTCGVGVHLPVFPLGRTLCKPKFPFGLHILVVGKLPVDSVEPRPLLWRNTTGETGRGLAPRPVYRHKNTSFFQMVTANCRRGNFQAKKMTAFCRHKKLSRKSMMVLSISSSFPGSDCTG